MELFACFVNCRVPSSCPSTRKWHGYVWGRVTMSRHRICSRSPLSLLRADLKGQYFGPPSFLRCSLFIFHRDTCSYRFMYCSSITLATIKSSVLDVCGLLHATSMGICMFICMYSMSDEPFASWCDNTSVDTPYPWVPPVLRRLRHILWHTFVLYHLRTFTVHIPLYTEPTILASGQISRTARNTNRAVGLTAWNLLFGSVSCQAAHTKQPHLRPDILVP